MSETNQRTRANPFVQRVVLAVVLACVFTACAGGLGNVGRVVDNEWTLTGATPDGQRFLVETGFNSCPRFEEWQVEVSADAVDVRARLWEPIAPESCNAIGLVERWIIELDEPLGDRTLRGCGREDCLAAADHTELANLPAAAVLDGVIVSPSALGAEALSPTGETRWRTELPMDAVHAAGGRLVAMRQDALVGLSSSSGDELWEHPGHRFAVSLGSDVLACSGGDSEFLSRIDATTGEIRWTVNAGCHPLAVVDGRVLVPTHDPATDGGMRLLIVDPEIGEVVVERTLDDGIDDQVVGIDGIAAAGDVAVLAGPQSDLVVIDSSGVELLRTTDRAGWPLGSVGNVVVVDGAMGDGAVDPATGEMLWFSQGQAPGSLAVSDGLLFAYDRESGSVSRFPDGTSPADEADAMWRVEIGRSDAWNVSVEGELAIVRTRLAVIALDATTGDRLWWVSSAPSLR